MASIPKKLLLKHGIPSLAIVVIVLQLFFVNTYKLNNWKGGGYGMYSEIHFYYNQIYISGLSVDSLETDKEIKNSLKYLKLMPNEDNLKASAELILKSTENDSIHLQIWKPTMNAKNGVYSRVLLNEIYLKNQEL